MPNFSKTEVLLVEFAYTDLSQTKFRPAIAVHEPHPSIDLIVVPLTSRVTNLAPGEFVLANWPAAGLKVPTAVKRGIATLHPRLVAKRLGRLTATDALQLENSLRAWLGLP